MGPRDPAATFGTNPAEAARVKETNLDGRIWTDDKREVVLRGVCRFRT
jgi:hypothetical protein